MNQKNESMGKRENKFPENKISQNSSNPEAKLNYIYDDRNEIGELFMDSESGQLCLTNDKNDNTTASEIDLERAGATNDTLTEDFSFMFENSLAYSELNILYEYKILKSYEKNEYQKIKFDNKIDLHECMNKAQAVEKLQKLYDLQSDIPQTIRVITGKGNNSKDGKVKLKKIALKMLEKLIVSKVVSHYDKSGNYYGESGAIVVYLNAKKNETQ